MKAKKGFVYIVTNKPNGTLYTGMMTDLIHRIYQHKNELIDGFTKKYGLKKLVYYEEHDLYSQAIKREKRLKEWKRQWKIDLIEKQNPQWEDLYERINQ